MVCVFTLHGTRSPWCRSCRFFYSTHHITSVNVWMSENHFQSTAGFVYLTYTTLVKTGCASEVSACWGAQAIAQTWG
ncbi:hypothetical protein EAM_3443 [Erwinia amylovora ATCC 49946]|nr:hypothetical protein EAM_3443 [Erwinia amylovora ATCC 49946]